MPFPGTQDIRTLFPRGFNASGTGSGGGSDTDGTVGSGTVMPASPVNPAFPTRIYGQDFLTDCNRGSFLATYKGSRTYNLAEAAAGNGIMDAYPTTYHDTRSKHVSELVDGRYGMYDPGGLSVSNSVMHQRIWFDPTLVMGGVTGHMRVSCPVPKLSATSWEYVGSSRVSVRARCVTPMPTIKVAWLGWPQNNASTTKATAGIPDSTSPTGFRGGDGELDWPEQDPLTSSDTCGWFMHKQNALSSDTNSTPIYGNKQTSGRSTVNFADGQWHTYTWERIVGSYNTSTKTWVGQSWKCFVDGVQIGTTQTQAVPMTPMRYALQTETTLSYSTPLNTSVDGDVEVDWITVDVP